MDYINNHFKEIAIEVIKIFYLDKPSYFDFEANYKYQAWIKHKGLPKNHAKQLYIAYVIDLDPSIRTKL